MSKDKPFIEDAIVKHGSSKNAPPTKVERIEATKSDVKELFSYNPLKLRIINENPNERISLYRLGSFIDLSDTPLMRNSKKIHSIKVVKVRITSNDLM